MKKQIKNYALTGMIICVLCGGAYIYGYTQGSGYLMETDYNISKDSTIDTTGDAVDAFMSEYTRMTWAGRDSYGHFYVIYKPTNHCEPVNTIAYTVFYEEDEEGKGIVRLKIIDERGTELVYKVSDYFKGYDKAEIKDSNDTGIVVTLTQKGSTYDLFLPIDRTSKPILVHGKYELPKSNTLLTKSYQTKGTEARKALEEITKNFEYKKGEHACIVE